jgi:hypothetical protein
LAFIIQRLEGWAAKPASLLASLMSRDSVLMWAAIFVSPYLKQQTPGCAPEPEAEFVQKVRGLFLAPACVQASFSAGDEKLALGMCRRGVSMEQITRAILRECARKYVAMLNSGTRTPITSLQYFADIVEEVKESAIPESYWEPLRSKMARMEQQWQKGSQPKP